MASRNPFPGMNPWLEHPAWWPNVHQSLITYARDALQARLADRYHVSIGERIYLEPSGQDFYPDAHVTRGSGPAATDPEADADQPVVLIVADTERREPFLEIIDASSGNPVVTVIELLSPANKRAGAGRDLYLRKQAEVLGSSASLVEIDLLRGGEPTVAVPAHQQVTHYRVVVARAANRDQRELYPIALESRLPRIAIPLAAGDRPIVLDLQRLLDETWQKSGLWRRIDYNRPPVPPLAPADAAWASDIVAAR